MRFTTKVASATSLLLLTVGCQGDLSSSASSITRVSQPAAVSASGGQSAAGTSAAPLTAASTAPPSTPAGATHTAGPAYVIAGTAVLPNRRLTPGHVFTTATRGVICVSGYTRRVRDVTLAEREHVFATYHIPYANHARYEVDHLISLELGGDNTVANLWPEPLLGAGGARVKDKIENRLHNLVCAGSVALATAQRMIATDWWTAYERYGGSAAVTYPHPTTAPAPPPAPVQTTQRPAPITTKPDDHGGATALCRDGTLSYSQHHRGTCSHHGGVAVWYH